MFSRNFLPILYTLFFLILFTTCDHETDTFDGPGLVDRFGEFSVIENLEISQPTVDFEGGESVFFTARFNKNVDWLIEITGMESGAVKRIEGFDNELTADNTAWNGGTTDLPFFKAEMCTVVLTVPETPGFMDEGTITILTTKTYEGALFTDFEEDPGSNIFFGNFEFELTNLSGRRNDGTAAQGDFYYYLEGTDDVVANFFVGLININSTITGQTYAALPTTVPENLYFNCFIHSDGSPHGIAVIQFVFDTNENGVFDDGIDATFQLPGDFPLNWEGWRHINHPMSETGISQSQLEKLVAVRVLLISDMNAQPNPPLQVNFGIDFITFTAGSPLEL